jgi:hypothetical protein
MLRFVLYSASTPPQNWVVGSINTVKSFLEETDSWNFFKSLTDRPIETVPALLNKRSQYIIIIIIIVIIVELSTH